MLGIISKTGGCYGRKERVKVIIHCKRCGETLRFVARKKDKIKTGFMRCICNNDKDLEMITEDL